MSGFCFRPAVRESVGLLIGIIGPSGSGKTFSAMRLASGLSGGHRFSIVDTEAGRAKHYADLFAFDHGDLAPPFTPARYAEAIAAADAAHYPVIVVDSCSHEHAGDGGLLDMHETELQRMAGEDWKKRESCKMAAWIKPKGEHKRMVSKLLQVRAHLILCFRAEEKVEMVKGADGRWNVVPKRSPVGLGGWIPVCEKNLPYELTASFMLAPERPGIPQPIKLQEQHRPFVPLDKPLDENIGKALAAWAGGKAPAILAAPKTDAQLLPVESRELTDRYRARLEEALDAAEVQGILKEIAANKSRLLPEHVDVLRTVGAAANKATQQKERETA